ncbi:MAG: glycerophosphodiester phosphodiesterase [Elusimicrobia bacterium]|nr:glycerophosphodiester phosphodiesterase [Elusimicrobiota bacterium]
METAPGLRSGPQILAHRGAALCFPENTLKAFRGCAQEGISGLECDVRFTREGEPVLFHDRDTYRLLGVRGLLSRKSYRELKELKVFGREPLPHLEDFFSFLAEHPSALAYLDLHELDKKRLEQILELLRRGNLLARCYLLDFSTRARWLRLAKQLEPRCRTAVMPVVPVAWASQARRAGAEALCVGYNHLRWARTWFFGWMSWVRVGREVEAAKREGVAITGGIANTPEDFRWFLERGFEGIWTDDIFLGRRVLRGKV